MKITRLFLLLTMLCVLATPMAIADDVSKTRRLENPEDFPNPGDWRDISRPGYRASPTPQSVEFYRMIKRKIRDGEEITLAERMTIFWMIKHRTWPEAPKPIKNNRGALDRDNKQPEISERFQQYWQSLSPQERERLPVGQWIEKTLGPAGAGLLDEDTPPTEYSEKFRQYWQSLSPQEKERLPIGRWMEKYLIGRGFDMRSDAEREADEKFQKEREERQQRRLESGQREESEAEREKRKEQEWLEESERWFREARERDAARRAEAEERDRAEEENRKANQEALEKIKKMITIMTGIEIDAEDNSAVRALLRGEAYLTVRHQQKDWYCTNKPVISASVTLSPVIQSTPPSPTTDRVSRKDEDTAAQGGQKKATEEAKKAEDKKKAAEEAKKTEDKKEAAEEAAKAKKAQALWHQARILKNEKKYAEAIAKYKEGLALSPNEAMEKELALVEQLWKQQKERWAEEAKKAGEGGPTEISPGWKSVTIGNVRLAVPASWQHETGDDPAVKERFVYRDGSFDAPRHKVSGRIADNHDQAKAELSRAHVVRLDGVEVLRVDDGSVMTLLFPPMSDKRAVVVEILRGSGGNQETIEAVLKTFRVDQASLPIPTMTR